MQYSVNETIQSDCCKANNQNKNVQCNLYFGIVFFIFALIIADFIFFCFMIYSFRIILIHNTGNHMNKHFSLVRNISARKCNMIINRY